jgi:hypothetical protein
MLLEAWRSAGKRTEWLVMNQVEKIPDKFLAANFEYCL